MHRNLPHFRLENENRHNIINPQNQERICLLSLSMAGILLLVPLLISICSNQNEQSQLDDNTTSKLATATTTFIAGSLLMFATKRINNINNNNNNQININHVANENGININL